MTDDRGAAALLTTVTALLLVVLTATVGRTVAEVLAASARARTAADAAALATLGGSPLTGGDGRPDLDAAAAVAAANGARLREVDVAAWPLGAIAHVESPTGELPLLGVRHLSARAAARLLPPARDGPSS